jgi:integrase
MSVRKRTWKTKQGELREAWLVDYTDAEGDRHVQTFERKKDAQEYHAKVKLDVKAGVHLAPSKSATVNEAAAGWLTYVKNENRERATVTMYEILVRRHIAPRLGSVKLSALTVPRIEQFRDDLLTAGLTRALAKKALGGLKAILRDAQRRGQVAQNVALGTRIEQPRRERPLMVGVDIPGREDVRRIIEAAPDLQARATLFVAAFAGLRASELRGLRWADVDLKASPPTIRVSQRADRYKVIGLPKSKTSTRTVPIGAMLANTLRAWRLQCPASPLDLVFPNKDGGIQYHVTMSNVTLERPQRALGMLDEHGRVRFGFHALRHYYASWCINRKADGGLELPLKNVSVRLGHASIQITADTYGHLFPSQDDGAELDAAERAIFAT